MTRLPLILILPLLTLSACKLSVTRNNSPLIDNLDGVWTYPKEQPGDTSVTVIKGMRYRIFDYYEDTGYELSRSGEVWGQEGVYFCPNEASYYSPKFFVEKNDQRFLILNKNDYDKYIREGRLEVSVLIRVADELDEGKPPIRLSIEVLGLPYDNPFDSANWSE